MSETTKRLHKVDPNLNIVPGGTRRRGITEQEWMASTGVVCSKCGREVFRSRDGMCLPCWEKENEMEFIDICGASAFLPQTLLKEIAHPHKKEE